MARKSCYPESLIEKTLQFVSERKKETGGFGATRLLPPTVEDTYHALMILLTIQEETDIETLPLDDNGLKSFLREREAEPTKNARTLFQIAKSMITIRMEPDQKKLKDFALYRISQDVPLEEIYYSARIFNEILQEEFPCPSHILNLKTWRTAKDLRMLMYSKGKDSISNKDKKTYVQWLQDCQNYDGGFGFMPGTTSYVENTHTCLRALEWLNSPPKDSTAAKNFILACRTVRGGFSRIQGAAPFLDATWHGIISLKLASQYSS